MLQTRWSNSVSQISMRERIFSNWRWLEFLCYLNSFWRLSFKQICKNSKSRLHVTWQLNHVWIDETSTLLMGVIFNSLWSECILLCLLWQPFVVYVLYKMTNVKWNLTRWIREGKQKFQWYLLWFCSYGYHILTLLKFLKH